MLRDITTSARLNKITSSLKAHKKDSICEAPRQVHFTEEGVVPWEGQLTIAMSDAIQQEKRQDALPKTPKKATEPTTPVIGSGSTWKQTEIDRFAVRLPRRTVGPENLLPKKWLLDFDFSSLENYDTCRHLSTHS
jgi:hypothetical protein